LGRVTSHHGPAGPGVWVNGSPAGPGGVTLAILEDPFLQEPGNIPYFGRSWRPTRAPAIDRRGIWVFGRGVFGVSPGANRTPSG